jgi:hypothetical protein
MAEPTSDPIAEGQRGEVDYTGGDTAAADGVEASDETQAALDGEATDTVTADTDEPDGE